MQCRGLFCLLSALLCLGGQVASAHAESPILVGILEDVEPSSPPSGMDGSHVRIAFEYREGLWWPWNGRYPPQADWTVVFDGRQLGTLHSSAATRPGTSGPAFGIEPITTEPAAIAHIKVGAANFDYSLNRSRNRPLLLSSATRFEDPDHWKPTDLSPLERNLAIAGFRATLPLLKLCDAPEEQLAHRRSYGEDEVLIIKAYRSRKDEVLVGERLDDRRYTCNPSPGPSRVSYWFVLRGGSAQLLDTALHGLRPLH